MAIRKNEKGPLVGRYFHSTTDGRTIRWQGYVWKHVGGPEDLYLLRLHEWMVGQEDDPDLTWPIPSEPRPEDVKRSVSLMTELISSKEMRRWRFYDSQKEMHACYKDYLTLKKTARGVLWNWLRASAASRFSAVIGERRK